MQSIPHEAIHEEEFSDFNKATAVTDFLLESLKFYAGALSSLVAAQEELDEGRGNGKPVQKTIAVLGLALISMQARAMTVVSTLTGKTIEEIMAGPTDEA